LFQIVGESGLAGAGSGAGEDVAGSIRETGSAECGVRSAEWGTERDDTLAAEQVTRAGLLDPAVGFVGFGFEFGNGLNGVTGRGNFGFISPELVGGGAGAGQVPVGFFIEAIGNGFDGVGENAVVVGDGEGEAGFKRGGL